MFFGKKPKESSSKAKAGFNYLLGTWVPVRTTKETAQGKQGPVIQLNELTIQRINNQWTMSSSFCVTQGNEPKVFEKQVSGPMEMRKGGFELNLKGEDRGDKKKAAPEILRIRNLGQGVFQEKCDGSVATYKLSQDKQTLTYEMKGHARIAMKRRATTPPKERHSFTSGTVYSLPKDSSWFDGSQSVSFSTRSEPFSTKSEPFRSPSTISHSLASKSRWSGSGLTSSTPSVVSRRSTFSSRSSSTRSSFTVSASKAAMDLEAISREFTDLDAVPNTNDPADEPEVWW